MSNPIGETKKLLRQGNRCKVVRGWSVAIFRQSYTIAQVLVNEELDLEGSRKCQLGVTIFDVLTSES
jgi:hypothetical protein